MKFHDVRLNSKARGRNGSFTAREASVYVGSTVSGQPCIIMDVYSHMRGKMPPIILELSRQESGDLIDALQDAVDEYDVEC